MRHEGVFAKLGPQAEALSALGYAIYLGQAAILHGYEYAKSDTKSAEKLWRIVIGTARS